MGLPDARDVRKACGRAAAVRVYTYGRGATLWWTQNCDALERCDNLAVFDLPASATQALAALAQRTMRLQCTIQDGHLWLTDGRAERRSRTGDGQGAGGALNRSVRFRPMEYPYREYAAPCHSILNGEFGSSP